MRLLFVTAVLVCGLFGTFSGTASAHAALTASDPKDGAVVDVAPKDVTLTFSEQIAMGDDSIRVLDPSSKRVDVAKMRDLSDGGTVRYAVDLKPGLPDGTYTVAWQAVSADSHPVSGAFTFSVGAPSETTATVSGQEAAAESSARCTTRCATSRTPDSSCSSAGRRSSSRAGSAARPYGRCSGSSSAAGSP